MKTIKELLAEHASELIPENGDRAYTQYHGREFLGILQDLRPEAMDDRSFGKLVPEDPNENWGFHQGFYGLFVGYEEEIKWDPKRGMFYAPADSD